MACPVLFVDHVQIALQSSDSVQVFGSCSLFLNLFMGHTGTEEHVIPGN